jgi:hypothetical protein
MSEKNIEKHPGSSAEKPNLKDIEPVKRKEAKPNKAELSHKKSELEHKGHEAEKVLKAEKEKLKLKPEADKDKQSHEKHKPHELEAKKPESYTAAEKKAVYKKEIKKVQAQLPKRSRTFSKFVHNPVVEKVSDVASKTVMRPSLLIGGSVVGLTLGLIVYIGARYYGYVIPNMTFILFLVVGAVVGMLVEFIYHRFNRPEDV